MKRRVIILISIVALGCALTACTSASWVAEAEGIAKVALPIVEGVTNIVGASPTVTLVENDINLLITLFGQYEATPAAGTLQQIQAALNTANGDIAQILPAAGIKNSSSQGKVAAILQLVTSEFSNIASLIPTASKAGAALPSEGASAHPSAGVKLPFTAKEFKAQYNKIVSAKTGDDECDRAFAGKELK
jgi:hypothetical protein